MRLAGVVPMEEHSLSVPDRASSDRSPRHPSGIGQNPLRVRQDELEERGLPEGSWYTVFADPTGGCELTVVSFEAGDAVAP